MAQDRYGSKKSTMQVAAELRRWGETVGHPIADMDERDVIELLEKLDDAGANLGALYRSGLSESRATEMFRRA